MSAVDSILAAAEDFRRADGVEALWRRLHHHLAAFAISGGQYACGMLTADARNGPPLILDSFDPTFLATKLREGVLQHDEYVRVGLSRTEPILWSDTDPFAAREPGLSPQARRSLEIDRDFGITTGVSIPIRTAHGLGTNMIGLHAGGLSWREFDRIWAEHGSRLITIVSAFDTALRRDHLDELFPLTASERDCLCWLAAGLKPKQIADRLHLTDKQVEKRLINARTRLGAATAPQAVATALLLGVIAP